MRVKDGEEALWRLRMVERKVAQLTKKVDEMIARIDAAEDEESERLQPEPEVTS